MPAIGAFYFHAIFFTKVLKVNLKIIKINQIFLIYIVKYLSNTVAWAAQQAAEEAAEQKSYEFVSDLLLANRFTIAEIADFAKLDITFVQKVRSELKEIK
ncbi:hypothetical protein GCM10023231_01360 [Olivibacter ginsenosidimutans]|uniref:Uncharacterized protein n=2 Tax=Olivibacter ginsenosidimutans TaxID=1176537 RepID=A0ABP9AF56_9SPHI